ncbi:Gfo/Idh/MocA family protein [Desertibaculum subflavum]|uniref:Gfo/Idh/MocA family protein n=1 Tax=Desertibaculum subflavum TaxID=2268458 RepID=UPI000E6740B8
MAATSYGVAVIGLGIMGRRMIANLGRHPRFSIQAAWDPSSEAVAAATAEHPDLAVVPDAASATGGLADLVYIACPPAFHRIHALAAMAAGKAVLCEKPLGTDAAESRDLVDRLEAAKVPNAVNFIQASCRAVETIAGALKDGSMGQIRGISVGVHFARWPRDWQVTADWLRFRAEGGFTREVLSHYVFLIERLLGPAKLLGSTPVFQSDPALCETHITAALRAGGVPVTIVGGTGGAGPDRVEMLVHGDRRSYRLHDWFWLQMAQGNEAWSPVIASEHDARGEGFTRQLDNMAAWLDGRPHHIASARDALSVQNLIEGMLAQA